MRPEEALLDLLALAAADGNDAGFAAGVQEALDILDDTVGAVLREHARRPPGAPIDREAALQAVLDAEFRMRDSVDVHRKRTSALLESGAVSTS